MSIWVVCNGLIRYVWSYIVCVFFLIGSVWGNRGSLEQKERRPRSDRACGEGARLGSGQSCQGMLYMACEVVSVCVFSVCIECAHILSYPSHPKLVVSCLPGRCPSCNMLLVRSSLWNSEERVRAQPEDADGIDFPGEFRFVRCVCLRECTHGFRGLEFANVL